MFGGRRRPQPAGPIDPDEGLAAWISQDYLLDEFTAEDNVPDLPAHPFNVEGLRVAERAALRRFADIEACKADPDMMFKYVRFIGECFIVGLGSQWTNRESDADEPSHFIGVTRPWAGVALSLPTLVTSAVHRRTGEEWAFVYTCQAEDKAAAPERDRRSRAVVLYVGRDNAWPHVSAQRVLDEFGDDGSELARYAASVMHEADAVTVDWTEHTLASAGEEVAAVVASRHRELTPEAAEALAWKWTFDHR